MPLKSFNETGKQTLSNIDYAPHVGKVLLLQGVDKKGRSGPALVKRFRCEEGRVKNDPRPHPAYFKRFTKNVSTLLELRDMLRAIQTRRDFVLCLNSELTEEGERLARAGESFRRKSKGAASKDDYPATLQDAPTCFVTIDIDELEIPDVADYVEYTDYDAIRVALPEAFHDVSVVRQLSSSAGIKERREGPGRVVKAHYFFTLVDERGAPRYVSRTWWKAYMLNYFPLTTKIKNGKEQLLPIPDTSLNDRSKLVYTGLPILAPGVPNDFTDDERVEYIEKRYPAAVISDALHAEVEELLEAKATRDLTDREKAKRKDKVARSKEARTAEALTWEHYDEIYPSVPGERVTVEAILESTREEVRADTKEAYHILRDYCSLKLVEAVREGSVGALTARNAFFDVAETLRPEKGNEYERLLVWRFSKLSTTTTFSAPDLHHVPSLPSEFNEVARDVVKRGINGALANPQDVHVVKLPPGAGKSFAMIELALRMSVKRPVIFALATNALAKEKYDAAVKERRKDAYADLPITTYPHLERSRKIQCTKLNDNESLEGERYNAFYELSEASLSTSDQSFCSLIKCPKSGSCPAQIPSSSILGGLTFTTHALLDQVSSDRLPKNALLIYDELPTLHYNDSVTRDELLELVKHDDERVSYLATEATLAFTKLKGKCTHATLVSAFDELPRDRRSELKDAAQALQELGVEFTLSTPQDLLEFIEGRHNHAIFTPKHRRAIKHICDAVLKNASVEVIRRAYQKGAAPQDTLEHHRVWRPREIEGEPLSTLILDATPSVDLKWICELHGRGYAVHAPPQGALRGEVSNAYHRETSAVDNYRLFAGRETLCGDHGGIAQAAKFVRGHLSLSVKPGARVGVITSKRLREAIEDGREREYQLREQRESLTDALSAYSVIYGHYGADSRASNRFEECEALVVLGAYKIEQTELRARLRAMRRDMSEEEFKAYAKDTAQDELEQAIGRARTWRRECPIIYVGSTRVRCGVDEGLIWEHVEANGRPRTHDKAVNEVRELLEAGHSVTALTLRNAGGMRADTASKKIKELFESGEGRYVWGPKEGKFKTLALRDDLLDDVLDKRAAMMRAERYVRNASPGVVAEKIDEALEIEPFVFVDDYVESEREGEVKERIKTANEDEQRVSVIQGERGAIAFRDKSGTYTELVKLLAGKDAPLIARGKNSVIVKRAQRDLRTKQNDSYLSAILKSIKRERERATAEHVPF